MRAWGARASLLCALSLSCTAGLTTTKIIEGGLAWPWWSTVVMQLLGVGIHSLRVWVALDERGTR